MTVGKRFGVVILMVIMIIMVMAGCSDAENKNSSVDNTPANNTESLAKQSTSNDEAGGFPIVTDPVTLRVFGCRDGNHAAWKDVLVFKEYEKMTNVKMAFEETPQQGCAEKRNLLFASNELPDIFLRAALSNNDLARYGMKEKVLIPLEGLIEQYAPNLVKLFEEYPDAKQSITAPDGHIYALPQMKALGSERTDKIWINQTWLDKLSLNAPTNVEELKTVLRAFKDNDPNGNGQADEIPLGIRDMGMVYRAFSGSWGLDRQLGENINIKDGKVSFWITDGRFKEMLIFLNEMYNEKILWADFYKADIPAWRSNLSQALFGTFFIQASDPFSAVEAQFTGMNPIVGPHGDQQYSGAQPIAANGGFAITSINKNPEASIKWIDYFYGEEGSIFFRLGVENQTYTVKDGMPVFNDEILNDSRGFMTAVGEINLTGGGGFPHLIIDKSGGPINNDKVRELQSFIEEYIPAEVYGPPIFDVQTADEILPIKADIDKFLEESVAKFIIGELSFDKWDDYVNTLNKMKLEKLEEAYQGAYDSMVK